MKRIAFTIAYAIGLGVLAAPGPGLAQETDHAVSPAVSAAATALSRADVALARSYVGCNAFKGSFGESVAERTFVDTYLTKHGNWRSITPRSGPQGLDHLFVKTRDGVITDVMVGESKYNTSRLGTTVDGNIQMGDGWIGSRLKRLGWRYGYVSKLKDIGFGNAPLNPARKLCVVLKDGKKVYFWADGRKWSFSGTRQELGEAQLRASQYCNYLDKAACGAVKYRSRVFNIVPRGNDAEIVIYDAKGIVNGDLHAARPQGVIRLKDALVSHDAVSERELAAQIQRKLGLDETDSVAYARRVLKEFDSRQLMEDYSLVKDIAVNSAKATAIAVAIDTAVQLVGTGDVDFGRLALDAGSVYLGTTAGQVAHVMLTSPVAYNVVHNISEPLHLSTPMATSALSSAIGGVVTSALLSYGGYFLGYADLKTANRNMIIGTASTGAGIAFTSGAMLAATAWGTAGTGAAISSLSGAAASNAALAWLGGGTLASGGGGMALGAAILSGGLVVVVSGVGTVLYCGCAMYDQHVDTVRVHDELGAYLGNGGVLDAVLKNDRRYRSLAMPCK